MPQIKGEFHLTELSIVIPSYKYRGVISDFFKELVKTFPKSEFIITNDKGIDNWKWKELIKKYSSYNIKHLIITHVGKGYAVESGFVEAKGDFIGFIDDDGSVSAKDFKSMFEFLKKSEYDGIIASRVAGNAKIIKRQSLFRVILGKLFFYLIVRLLFGLKYKDTQCGAKIFRRDAAKKFLPFKTKGFSFDLEILLKSKNLKFKIKEFGIKWEDKMGSAVSFKRMLEMLYEAFLLKKQFIK